MKFKKIICGLISLSFLLGTQLSANALPMKRILEEMSKSERFGHSAALDKIKNRTMGFIIEERKKKLSFYDHAYERSDSLAFVFFCYLCICEDAEEDSAIIEAALNRARGNRSAKEHEEDMAVINDILPQNVAEFSERFGILLNEDKRFELSEILEKSLPKATSPVAEPWEHRRVRLDDRRRGERKPDRNMREAMLDGIYLFEEGYGD